MSHNRGQERQDTDAALVRRFRADADSALGRAAAAELFGRYQRAVYLWCFRYTQEHEQALDLAQDVLLKAFQSLPLFRGDAQFSSWLFAIARNCSLNAVRRGNVFVELDAVEDTIADPAATPEQAVDDHESETMLIDLVKDTLEPIEQRAIWMRCVERLSVDEITARLELDTSTGARGLLQAARRKLRAALEQQRKHDEGGQT